MIRVLAFATLALFGLQGIASAQCSTVNTYRPATFGGYAVSSQSYCAPSTTVSSGYPTSGYVSGNYSYAPPVTTVVQETNFPTYSSAYVPSRTFVASAYQSPANTIVIRDNRGHHQRQVAEEVVTQKFNAATIVGRDRVQIIRDNVPVAVTKTVKTVTFGH